MSYSYAFLRKVERQGEQIVCWSMFWNVVQTQPLCSMAVP